MVPHRACWDRPLEWSQITRQDKSKVREHDFPHGLAALNQGVSLPQIRGIDRPRLICIVV